MSKKTLYILSAICVFLVIVMSITGYVLNKRYIAERIRAEAAVLKYQQSEADFKAKMDVVLEEKELLKKAAAKSDKIIEDINHDRVILKERVAADAARIAEHGLNSSNYLQEYNTLRDHYIKLVAKDEEEITALKKSNAIKDGIVARAEEAYTSAMERLDSCNKTLGDYKDSMAPRKFSLLEKAAGAGIVVVVVVGVVKILAK